MAAAKRRRLLDAYRFTGFRPVEDVRGVFGDPLARIITLVRSSKKRSAAHVDASIRGGTIAEFVGLEIFPPVAFAFSWSSRSDGSDAFSAAR